MRLSRLIVLAAAAAGALFVARGIAWWFQERRARTVFPASNARELLNPLRNAVMPVARTLDRFGISAGHTVLEVGPGPGYYSIEASRRIGSGGQLLCFDLQRGMIDVLRERLGEADAEAETGVADATHLPLRDASVDVAYLVTVLGEVPDPEAALAEMRRVLKPDGTLGFSESFGDPDYVRLGHLRKMCEAAGFTESARYRDPLGYTITFRAV